MVRERMGCLTIRRRARRTSPMEMSRFIPVSYVTVRFRRSFASGMAGAFERAPRIARALPESAGVHHAEVADREVELHRIDRVDRAQRRGDVRGHPPAGTLERGQPQALTDANDVRVERHDQLARPHLRPHAEIDAIVRGPSSAETGSAACRRRRTTAARRNTRRRAAASCGRRSASDRSRARASRTTAGRPTRPPRRRAGLRRRSLRSSRSARSSDEGSTPAPRSRRRWSSDARGDRSACDRARGRTRARTPPATAPSPPACRRSNSARSGRGRRPAPPR